MLGAALAYPPRVPTSPSPSGELRPTTLEEKRSHAERMALLARLADGLAHEIKNPLSTMAINLALMQEDWERAGASRGSAEPLRTPREERSLFEQATRERGTGRPTKRERRETDRLHGFPGDDED